MVSGNAESDFLLRAFDSGIDDYMIKPVNYDLLWQKIGSMVQRFALQRLADEQQLALRHWKDAAEREQALASYLYDGFLRHTSESSSFLQVWIQSSDSFSGDCILQFAGLDGSQYIMVADAMGHGLAAAVSLMPLIRIFADKARKATPLTQMLYAMNDAGNSLLPDDRFVAAALIRLLPASREAEVWNGGLPPILVTDKQGNILTRCNSMHMPLGILDKFQFDAKPQTVSINENTLLIAFTDGMIETPDQAGNCLNDTSIAALVAQDATQLSAIKHMVTTQMKHPDDDISVGVVDCGALLSHGSDDSLRDNRLDQESQLTCHYRLCGQALANTDVPGQVARMLRMQSFSTHLIQTVFTVLTEL
jgi:serine phosphatase RsbU (regulator of sigma subunit)